MEPVGFTDMALGAGCPECGAEPGRKCHDGQGHEAPGVLIHAARVSAWRLAEQFDTAETVIPACWVCKRCGALVLAEYRELHARSHAFQVFGL